MNMLRTTLIASAFAAILGVGNVIASEPDRSLGETIDDASITAAVKTELLADKRTEGFDINVDTRNGNVTLRGGADTLADKLAATELARKVKGVRSVDNDIVIAADGSERRQDANTATASGEVREAAEEAGDEVSDAWITGKVKSQLLADDVTPGMKIDVDTEDRIVSLKGTVPSLTARNEAIRIASHTKGVRTVDADELIVQ
ncbi:MAG: BON domain-containing protein [Rhodanobacteraceae bacterium]|jgi:osmotically-inducible protein OsmY|nr:BON domain-containing protein [Rhodanobacteraceae bacterium]MBL0040455.1 BON domain-containing protein [Xanthomonadales bacterium]MBP6078094.1 BON domain-containing protein [Xanthomonadales bacterium]